VDLCARSKCVRSFNVQNLRHANGRNIRRNYLKVVGTEGNQLRANGRYLRRFSPRACRRQLGTRQTVSVSAIVRMCHRLAQCKAPQQILLPLMKSSRPRKQGALNHVRQTVPQPNSSSDPSASTRWIHGSDCEVIQSRCRGGRGRDGSLDAWVSTRLTRMLCAPVE
jgi:hypothetical protein